MVPNYRNYGRPGLLLEKIIPEYNNKILQGMLIEASALHDQVSRFADWKGENLFRICGMRNISYWYIEFTHTVPMYIPKCFKILVRNIKYKFDIWSFLGHVPSYIPSINHVVMRSVWNKGDLNNYIRSREDIFEKNIFTDGEPTKYYSPNLFERNDANVELLEESAHEKIRDCFYYCYWRLPTTKNIDSHINNLIYHNSSKVKNIISVRKTIIKINEISDRIENFEIFEGSTIKIKSATCSVLCDDGEKISNIKYNVILQDSESKCLKNGDVVNAILVKDDSRWYVMIGNLGSITLNDPRALIALTLHHLLKSVEDDSSLTKIPFKKFLLKLEDVISSNNEIFPASDLWKKDIPGLAQKGLESLKPLFFKNEDNLYHISPTLISYFSIYCPNNLNDLKRLEDVAKLFDTFKISSKKWGQKPREILNHDDKSWSQKVNHSNWNSQLLKASPRLANNMVFSRIISNHYTHMK